MPDRELLDATPLEQPRHEDVQQLIEAESGRGPQGIHRVWQASDSDKIVLVSDASGVQISRDNGTTAPTNVINVGTPAGGGLAGTYPNPTLSASTLGGLVKVGDPAGGALAGSYPNPTLAPATIDALIPVGTVWAYAGGGIPAGWLLCDGAAVSRTTYDKLFAAIATNYGAGDGSTTFNVPLYRGRVVLGEGPGHPLGQVDGNEAVPGPVHTHPGSHTHGLNGHSHTTTAHGHGLPTHVHGGPLHNHSGAPMTISGTAAASGSALNGRFTAGGVNTLPDSHTHAVSGNVAGNTADDGAGNTGLPGGYPSGPNTATTGVTTDGPSPPSSSSDATAPAASYGATIPTMMPFGVAQWIIRHGN